MDILLRDMEIFICRYGLGKLLSTSEGQDFVENYLHLKEKSLQ